MTKPVLKGTLKTWKEDRGFGFISPESGGRDLFIHISALGQTTHRPRPGDIVHYQVNRDRQGKLRAVNARIETGDVHLDSQQFPKAERSGNKWLTVAAIGLLALTGAVIYYLKSQNPL
mgnify:CR=1 FL=1